jgi:glucose-1-phosphate thymidylyltransferase
VPGIAAQPDREPQSGLKGVILAGGTGSRLFPLTKITNKHLLPIFDRPMINYAVEALVRVGVTETMIVTGGTHAGEFLRLLGNGHEFDVSRLMYAYQDRPGGIAEALGLAARFADDDPVIVMLADNVFEYSIAAAVDAFRAEPHGARVLLSEVAESQHLQHLGVAEFDSDGRLARVVEKPQQPPSQYAVTGVYCYDASVFSVIQTLEPSARGELEITDVNNYYAERGELQYNVVDGFWGDAGESIDGYYAVNDFVRRHGANNVAAATPERS